MESISSPNFEYLVNGVSSVIERAPSVIIRFIWLFLHFLVTLWLSLLGALDTLQSYFISAGLLEKYKAFDLANLKTLAIVVESQDAYDTSRVVQLLRWLSDIGVKNICLYDMDGVLKKSKQIILEELGDARLWQPKVDEKEKNNENSHCEEQKEMILEFASFSDGREGIAKAANYLGDQDQPVFTEKNMSMALKEIGYGGREPSLLFVYGPVRCHLGFPAWRLRYTEILHMGTLQSMKYGAIVKAIQKFAKVHQNYGT